MQHRYHSTTSILKISSPSGGVYLARDDDVNDDEYSWTSPSTGIIAYVHYSVAG